MTKPTLAALQARLGALDGRDYWRRLEELAETPGFADLVQDALPRHAAALLDPIDRRKFLKLMGASLALGGLGACTRQPNETIVPYVKAPEAMVPGKPLFFASALALGGAVSGVLVESHEGRPTKVEGNPDHPASLGATDVFAQAAVLGLYDPDRSQTVTYAGTIRTWGDFLVTARGVLAAERVRQGAGLRILTETVTSPTLAAQLREILAAFPAARWHQFEPVGRDMARAGARLAFGEPIAMHYRLEHAEVVLALDADFLASGPGHLRYAREFTARRRGGQPMNRLYAVESTPSLTGAMADHKLPLRAAAVEGFARAVAAGLGLAVGSSSSPSSGSPDFLRVLVRDLQQHRGTSLVVAGEGQLPAVHALAHAMNHALGNVGRTVIYTGPIEAEPVDQIASLGALVRDMDMGGVETLIIVGGNPVFTAPVDLRFSESLARVPLRIHLSLYDDETSALCHWHIPEAHPLEAWGDVRGHDGTVSIVQPLIAPLYGGKTAHELLAAFSDQPERSAYDLVRAYWQAERRDADFEGFWRRTLHDGIVAGSAFPPKKVSLRWTPGDGGREVAASGLEVVFRPDPSVFDGRFANNGWLQELPRPFTTLTWDNAALLSPATAERLELETGDVVELRYQGRPLRAPVAIVPGHADESVTLHLGYGRTRAGRVGTGVGFDAYPIRTAAAPWFASGLELRRTGERHLLAFTQGHHRMEGRNPVRTLPIAVFLERPGTVHEMGHVPASEETLYPGFRYDGHAWGMSIDLSTCIGCNACTIACQAENNIPVVGKLEVARGREMHWIRVDTYYDGDLANPATLHQPLPCMHCENAPCETVCPVEATVHSAEGLNDMVYNRCVGTRYCSNNCPYKVRRFNFFQYADYDTPSLKLGRNPDVTVRSRGVMEKCTYCVQRINAARITAEKEDRPLRDGEIVTACQAVCPAEAIVFGDVNDPESRVARLKADARSYGLLAELNTRPRTTYLAVLRNPNPELT